MMVTGPNSQLVVDVKTKFILYGVIIVIAVLFLSYVAGQVLLIASPSAIQAEKTRVIARRNDLTDFWAGTIGLDYEAGDTSDYASAISCVRACRGGRPAVNPWNVTIFKPLSSARVKCHDTCETSLSGVSRFQNTVCGYQESGLWQAIPVFPILACL
jgi:hypothetical protein